MSIHEDAFIPLEHFLPGPRVVLFHKKSRSPISYAILIDQRSYQGFISHIRDWTPKSRVAIEAGVIVR